MEEMREEVSWEIEEKTRGISEKDHLQQSLVGLYETQVFKNFTSKSAFRNGRRLGNGQAQIRGKMKWTFLQAAIHEHFASQMRFTPETMAVATSKFS